MTNQQESLKQYIRALQQQLEKCRSVKKGAQLTRELIMMEDQLERLIKGSKVD